MNNKTNYEKLCEAAGIKPEWRDYRVKNGKVYNGKNPKNRNIHFLNLDFTAEKQIELIKMIMKAGSFAGFTYDAILTSYVLCFNLINSQENVDFSEALAGLALHLIEAGELDKEEVRRVLE